MKITEEHRKKAFDIKIMLSRLEPEVRYTLAQFMDLYENSDEGMRSQCVYEALETADVYSNTGDQQKFVLAMGMSLKPVNIAVNFQDIGDGCYETVAEILPDDEVKTYADCSEAPK
jgi:hypothetical protein